MYNRFVKYNMSQRKYKNPVNNHFIYNDEIRKSTCKVCYFDMAGRHSENLMRHLKRKHPATYAEVMLEKQRRRSTNPNKSGSGTGPLSAMFKFETEPHKLFIKSTPEAFLNDNEENSSNQTASGQFEDVYIGKTELDEQEQELAQSPGEMNDSSESLSYRNEHKIDQNQYIITDLAESVPSDDVAATNAVATGSSSVSSSKIVTVGDTQSTPISISNPDDAFFLQYLGNKFTKYSTNTKNTVQFHINRILYKADMGCYDSVDCSKLSDAD